MSLCSRLGVSLQACLLQIVGYRNLIAEVEKLRREAYDSEDPQHEEMLLKVSSQGRFRRRFFKLMDAINKTVHL